MAKITTTGDYLVSFTFNTPDTPADPDPANPGGETRRLFARLIVSLRSWLGQGFRFFRHLARGPRETCGWRDGTNFTRLTQLGEDQTPFLLLI